MSRNSFDAFQRIMMGRKEPEGALQAEPVKKLQTFDGRFHTFPADTPDTDIERFQWRYDNGQDVSPAANVRTVQPLGSYANEGEMMHALGPSRLASGTAPPLQFDQNNAFGNFFDSALTNPSRLASQRLVQEMKSGGSSDRQLNSDVATRLVSEARKNSAAGETQPENVPVPLSKPDYSQYPPGVRWTDISGGEGGRFLKGYWPGGESGVTIATGFDMGRHSERDLRQMGFPPHLIEKFRSFLSGGHNSVTGRAAEAIVNDSSRNPNVTWEEALLIDRLVATYKYKEVAKSYNEAHNNGPRFEQLPSDAQTAIMDVAFNHGENLADSRSSDARIFWRYVKAGQWEDAYQTLSEGFKDVRNDDRKTLRRELMKSAISSGQLPPAYVPVPTPRPKRPSAE